MNRLIIFCSIIWLLVNNSFAETIDGPANLRVSLSGVVAVSLNDGISVSVLERTGDWFKVRFMAFVDQESYSGGLSLNGDVMLYGTNGQQIGKSVNSFSDFEQFKIGQRYGLVVTLYTYKSNIVPSSIIEDEVVKLINADSFDEKSLQKLKYLKAQRWSNIEGYYSGIVFEPITDPMGQAIRLVLIFNNSRVVAFAGNSKFEDYEFDCVGKSQVPYRNLIIYYLEDESFAMKESFEASLKAAFSKMD